MFSLKNKKAVITGAGSGIGKAIAVLFAKQGAEVHIIELTEESAKATLDEIKANDDTVFSHACNVANQQQVLNTFDAGGHPRSPGSHRGAGPGRPDPPGQLLRRRAGPAGRGRAPRRRGRAGPGGRSRRGHRAHRRGLRPAARHDPAHLRGGPGTGRVHLVKLFDVFPPGDPKVSKARATLSGLLF